MNALERFFEVAVDYAWGWPLVVLLIGGGLYLTALSRFLPLFAAGHALEILRGKYDNPDDPGEISHLQALSTALASTIGVGNISGVAIAISQGGPGAIFWMWVAALVGMTTKFFTCTLACMYRRVDHSGVAQGGPMYFIEVGLGPKYRFLAIFFSCCGLVGCLSLLQANQLAEVLYENHGFDRRIVALLIVIVVGAVILGGLRRIARWCEKLVPAMCLLYVAASVVVLALRAAALPEVFGTIISEAFTGSAVAGGAIGTVIVTGVKRAAFSNEAGIGTAPMAHGAAKTNEPVREGLVAMLGPFIDTIVVCTMTALVILSSGPELPDTAGSGTVEGVGMTSRAFAATLGPTGSALVTASVVLFSISTMFGYSYYGRKCLGYLAGEQRSSLYNYVYLPALGLGAVWSADLVVNIIDTSFALMAIPTMTGTLLLAPRVTEAMQSYFARYTTTK